MQPRGRGKPRERNRHRFPGRKDDRNFKELKEEEARFMEVRRSQITYILVF